MWSVLLGLVVVSGLSCGPASVNRPTVAFVSNNAFEFWSIARKGTEKAGKEENVNVEFLMPPTGDAAEQKRFVEQLLAKGVSGIAVSPNDPENSSSFYDEVAGRVNLVATDNDFPSGSKRLCYIGTNNFEAGLAAGELVKEAIPDGGEVMIFVGKIDASNAVQRRNGVIAALGGLKTYEDADKLVKAGYPVTVGKYVVLNTLTDDAKKDECKRNAGSALLQNKNLKCLVGLWAYNPPAIINACHDAGLLGKVKIVGFDEDEETLDHIKQGNVHGTVVQQPFLFGYESVRILSQLAKGNKDVLKDKRIKDTILHVPHKQIRKDNVEEFHKQLKEWKGS
jgi:ribose transport system substrate-binding protein